LLFPGGVHRFLASILSTMAAASQLEKDVPKRSRSHLSSLTSFRSAMMMGGFDLILRVDIEMGGRKCGGGEAMR